MDAKRLEEFMERVSKKSPKPVLVVVTKGYPSGKDNSIRRHCGVFGFWNGSQLKLEDQPIKKQSKAVKRFIRMPFYWECIVSVRIANQQDLINYANCLFDILEDVESRKEELANRS